MIAEYPAVIAVAEAGVAAEAGLEVGDVIRTVNGRDVRSLAGNSILFDLPTLDFVVGYERNGQERSAFMNRRIVDRRGLDNDPPSTEGAWAVVVRGAQLRASLAQPVARDGTSVRFLVAPYVAWLAPEGVGERAGLQTQDVVTHVNGESVLTARATQMLLAPPQGRPLQLTVRRGNRELTVGLPPW
jgi:S1-C subfamily serine protease